MTENDFLALLTKLLIAGGGGAAVAFGVFKYLGGKWLDGRFAARQATINAGFAERLQQLKSDEDRALRHIQSSIDREIHRAKKLYDREFDVLSEVWMRLCDYFDSVIPTAFEQYQDVGKFTMTELNRFLDLNDKMLESEKDHLRELESSERTAFYRRWLNVRKVVHISTQRVAFHESLYRNAIFMSPGFKERFEAIKALVIAAEVEFEMRLDADAPQHFDQWKKLHTEGPALRQELEAVINKRLWSAAEIKG